MSASVENLNHEDVAKADDNCNYVTEIEEADCVDSMNNSSSRVDMIKMLKNDSHLSAREVNNENWARVRKGWTKRSTLERSLFLVTCGLVVFMLVMFPVLHILNADHAKQDDGCSVCTSPACVSASSRIMSIMDPTVDPCQDFYQYACGRWIQSNPVPAGRSSWSTLERMWQDFQVTMKHIFEQPREFFKSEAERRAQLYYQSCLDVENTKETLGAKPILELLSRIGGWPADTNTTPWNFELALQIAHNTLNSGGFFKWTLKDSPLNTIENLPHRIIQILPSDFSVPFKQLTAEEVVSQEIFDSKSFTLALKKVIRLLNIDTLDSQMIAKEIFELEVLILEMIYDSMFSYVVNDQPHNSPEVFTLSHLQSQAPFLNWTSYFNSAFSQVNISITSSQPIVYQPEFFKQLHQLITELTQSENGTRKLQNYMGWHVIKYYLPYLSKNFRDLASFLGIASVGSMNEIWQDCIDDTNDVMDFAVGAMYVRHSFNPESKVLASSMVTAIKKAFKNNFDYLKWMDFETRNAAKEKADAMTDKIGYPRFILEPAKLDRMYNDLEINPKEYFQNIVRLNQFTLCHHWRKLYEPFDKTFWNEVKPSSVNAYYSRKLNQIILPAGGLKEPLFDVSLPQSLNFGAMGAWMGHELTHGFDNHGRKYDRNGNFRQWWNNATIERFNERTECLIRQYSSYQFKEQHIDGKKTLGENIADNGGLKAAFHAFNNWVATRNEDILLLPGLNMTQKQLFFLSFAQVWCSSSTDGAIRAQMLTDPHSPARFRVIGTLSNMPEFSAEFNCRLQTPMNPTNKCEVW